MGFARGEEENGDQRDQKQTKREDKRSKCALVWRNSNKMARDKGFASAAHGKVFWEGGHTGTRRLLAPPSGPSLPVGYFVGICLGAAVDGGVVALHEDLGTHEQLHFRRKEHLHPDGAARKR